MGKLVAVLSLVILLMPGLANANLLVNPSFETGTLASWSVDWNSVNLSVVSFNPHDGVYHASNSWDGGMYQDTAITGGQQYRLTGWAYIPAGAGGSPWGTFIGLRFLDSVGATVGDYQIDMEGLTRDQYNMADTGFVTADPTAVTARARFGTWSSSPWEPVNPTDFDHFDLTPIPEPTSLLLLGSGLVGLVGLTKKRKFNN